MEENLVGASENTISTETNEQTEAVETLESTEESSQTEVQGSGEAAAQTDGETSAVVSVTEDTPFLTVKYISFPCSRRLSTRVLFLSNVTHENSKEK